MKKEDVFKIAFNITAWFETSGEPYTSPSGNFDKQGLSWGPRQNCIGQGSLQPLLRRMLNDHPDLVAASMNPFMVDSMKQMLVLPTTQAQTDYVISKWNDDRGRLAPAWNQAFSILGQNDEIQAIFIDDARGSIPAVDSLAAWIAINDNPTVREWCLAYDFVTQNGGFHSAFKAAISTFLLALKPFQKDFKDRMRAICWLRAGWTYIRGQRKFADDVLGRKLLITEGFGRFRGEDVDLDGLFKVNDEGISG